MTAQFDSWDSYFWEPGGPVLRNLYGERDGAILAHKEYGETSKQYALIETGTLPIPRTYDAAHLRLLHYELFKNVFEWAGEYRTVTLFKAPLEFAPPGDIGRYLDDASRIVRGSAWATMDRHQFASTAAEVFAYVNQAHPFREGNGRAGKLFMQQVSELSQYKLEYSPELSGVTREMWNNASAMSRPDLGSYAPVPDTLIPIFERMTAPRMPERTHETQRARSQASEQESPSLEHRLETKLGELRARRDPTTPNPTETTTRDVPEARDGDRPYQPPGDRGPRTGR